jgi:hypothetical protein
LSTSELTYAVIERLLPLVVAAGLDLNLTLLLLGASALLGWPAAAPTDPLTDLGTPVVVTLAGLFYAAETGISRLPWATTVWNVANTIVRMVGVGSLAVLTVETPSPLVTGLAVLGASVLAVTVHATRTGWWLELDLRAAPGRARVLTIGAEDIVVVALLPMILHRPSARLLLAVLVLGIGALGVRRHLSAGAFAHRLVLTWIPGVLARGRWLDASGLPVWAHHAAGTSGPGDHAIRCAPVVAYGSAVSGRLRRGWLVMSLSGPLFVWRNGHAGNAIDLSAPVEVLVRPKPLHQQVDLVLPDGRRCGLAIPRGGPGIEMLRQLFRRDPERPGSGTP